MSDLQPYIGVDFDGTLAREGDTMRFERGKPFPAGAPVPAMVARVKRWLAEGQAVRIITARMAPDRYHFGDTPEQQRALIEAWCLEHIGQALPVQAHKCYLMLELWDDRAVGVSRNTGEPHCCSMHGCDGLLACVVNEDDEQ